MHMPESVRDAVVVDYAFADPIDNLCYDDTLLQMAEAGAFPAVLRFWESPTPFIVLGRSGNLAEELHVDVVRAAGIPVYRRSSGGGTVVQGPGCLNYAWILPKQKAWEDVRASYFAIAAWLLDALAACGINATYEPISDLAMDNRKFSGNAQRRGRTHILQHGTLLYDFDLSRISCWLAQPRLQPPYRANRAHADFVSNIPVDPQTCKAMFTRNLASQFILEPLPGSLSVLQKQRSWGRVESLPL